MSPIEAARREWPALHWRRLGWPGRVAMVGCDHLGCTVVVVAKHRVRGWTAYNGILLGKPRDAPTLTAALRAARYALLAHFEHVPRTPLAVARQDWPVLRWTCEHDRCGGWCLRGFDGRQLRVIATKWPGWGWLVSYDDGMPTRAKRLVDGLRAVRRTL